MTTLQPSFFLGVERSVTGRSWVDRLDPAASRTAQAMAQQTDLGEVMARILAGRGVGIEQTVNFLDPTLRDLMPDPSSLTGLDAAVARLAQAIETGERVAFFGDYDVDGAATVSLFTRYWRHFGLDPLTYIPDRIFEGYGPNIGAMDMLIEQGASLIVTLDCGTTSHEPIAHARSRGADVLVIDHHLASDELPKANAVVNPNRSDDISGLGHLSAAGVGFMVLVGLSRALRLRATQGRSASPSVARNIGLPDLMSMADLVALSTICDVVPLKGLNRAFVRRGLDLMRLGGNAGMRALALSARLNGPMSPYHLGFMLGPRINAGGRIGDAGLGARLLCSIDEHEILELAGKLDELNSERQRIEREAVDEAVAVAEAEIGEGEGPAVLVLASEHWHAGIVGLVAARLRERFDRPAFAIALNANGTGTGSGRSMPGVDLGQAVLAAVAKGHLLKGGGHAMAAGITVEHNRLTEFRAFVNDHLGEAVSVARRNVVVKIDAAMTARAASVDFVHQIERAGPFGTGNPGPLFAFPAHKVRYAEIVGVGGHIRFTAAAGDGAQIKAIAFRAAHSPLGNALIGARDGAPLHLAGALNVDTYQGRERVQLRLIDAAIP